MLYVFNKIDLINQHDPVLLALISQYTPNVMVYATAKEGVESLIEYLRQQFVTKTEKTIEYLEEEENL
jgi:50S ribosomal subunit-associated GTPase HflX